MKKIRLIIQHPLMIALLLISFLNISCNQDEIVESRINNITGEELFRSIIFADGIATKSISSLEQFSTQNSNFSPSELKEYRDIQSQIMSSLKENQPNYFSIFNKVFFLKTQKLFLPN